MKCPYTIHRKVVTKTTFQYNDEGQQKSWGELQTNVAEFCDCLQSDCAAYQNGKCCYKGSE